MIENISLGVIGGSGIYTMSGLVDTKEYSLDTPFGKPSGPIIVGTLEGKRVGFMNRHGPGHTLMPSEVNYRANIYAFKILGCPRILAISACGSLREDYAPGHFIIPDQLFDFTHLRPRSFFGEGLVAHVSVADPFCPDLSPRIFNALQSVEAETHQGGSFITIEGPRFSTRAESNTFRSWGMSLIGMTTSPEAFLAREAGICYAVIAHITDYDVWHSNEAPVTVEKVVRTLGQNTHTAQEAIRLFVRELEENRSCSCGNATSEALITGPDWIPPNTRKKLDLLIGNSL